MIDYLHKYEDEADAKSALTDHLIEAMPGEYYWDESHVIIGVQVYRVTGTEIITIPGFGDYEQDIREYETGWFVIIAVNEEDAALQTPACMKVWDRDNGDTVLYSAFDPDDVIVEPRFATRSA